MAKVKYPTLSEDALVDLKVSGSFYKELAQLLLSLSQELKPNEYQAILDKFKNKEPAADIKELNIILITALVFSIEIAAKEQNLTKEVEIEVPDQKDIN